MTVVYFASTRCKRFIKIGFSETPIDRLRHLQSTHWRDLELDAPVGMDFELVVPEGIIPERTAHALCQSSRIKGEYFRFDEQVKFLLGALAPYAISYEDLQREHVRPRPRRPERPIVKTLLQPRPKVDWMAHERRPKSNAGRKQTSAPRCPCGCGTTHTMGIIRRHKKSGIFVGEDIFKNTT